MSFLPSDDMKDYKPKNSSIKLITNKNNYEKNSQWQNDSKFKFKHLPPLDKPVPNDWLTIEDDFSLFLIVNLPLIGQELFVTPNSSNEDGVMYLSFVKADTPRYEIIKMLTEGETGNFLKSKWIEFVKCKAFRLEPQICVQTNKVEGNLMVDGEQIEYGPIQGEVSSKLARVLLNTNNSN